MPLPPARARVARSRLRSVLPGTHLAPDRRRPRDPDLPLPAPSPLARVSRAVGAGLPTPPKPPTEGLLPRPETCGRSVARSETVLTRGPPDPAFPPNVAHEPLPDFTEADFFKYLRRHDAVATRIERGDLPRPLLAEFHRKLGGTPRFVEQASAVLARIDPDALRDQLEGVADPPDDADPDDVRRLQQTYFRDLFLPQLYEALSEPFRRALSRLAVAGLPLPLDGVSRGGAAASLGPRPRGGRATAARCLAGAGPGPAFGRAGRTAAVRRVSAAARAAGRSHAAGRGRRPRRPRRGRRVPAGMLRAASAAANWV